MKKIILSLLVFTLLFTMTGCFSKKESSKKKDNYKKIYGLVEEYSSMDDSTKKYSDYKYNKDTGLIEEYKEQSGAYTTTYKLSYDNNKKNLIKKEEISKDTLTSTYEYNSDNTISKLSYTSTNTSNIDHGKVFEYREYKKDDKDRVISYSTYNVTRNNYKMDYTFKYDSKDKVLEETQTTDRSSYKIKYKYDKNGNKIKESIYKGNNSYPTYYKTYKYKVIGKYKK